MILDFFNAVECVFQADTDINHFVSKMKLVCTASNLHYLVKSTISFGLIKCGSHLTDNRVEN